MPRDRVVRRVRWKVVRNDRGWWQAVVLIGETPIHYPAEVEKSVARRVARAQAAKLKGAGQ